MDQIVLIRVLGIFFVLFGITVRMGYWKKLYWQSRGGIFGYIPLGLLFIWYSYYDALEAWFSNAMVIYYAVFGLLILLAVFLSVKAPKWVKPDWIVWVEKHPEKIRRYMADEAKDNAEWENRVVSQESVDEWAKKLAAKHH
jgi:hypothetical protein